MMTDATTFAGGELGTEPSGPLPLKLMLLMLDVMQARGRKEAAARLVDELYARGDGGCQASR